MAANPSRCSPQASHNFTQGKNRVDTPCAECASGNPPDTRDPLMNSQLRSPSRRSLLAIVAAAAFAVGGGAVAAAQHVAAGGAHAMSFAASPADLADHIAQFSEHVYAATGATPEQKTQIDPILRQAGSDLAA